MSNIAPTGYWDGQNPFHAMSKPLVDWIIDFLKNDHSKQIYDFGCGIGMYLNALSKAGFINLCGFEGNPPINKVFSNIIKQDLSSLFMVEKKGIIISLEVAEHIPSQFTDNYLNNIFNACGDGEKFICSWAVRGQGGSGHVNELNNDEAIKLITAKGFSYLEQETQSARSVILPSENIAEGHLPWFKNTILIFEKKINA